MIDVNQNLTVLSRLVSRVKFHKLPHFTRDVTGQHYRRLPSDVSLPRISERRRRLKFRLTACIPHHMHVFGYPMKTWMKIFKDLYIVSKSLEIWIQYPNVH